MDSAVLPTVGILAVVILGLVIAAFTRNNAAPEATVSSVTSAPPAPPPSIISRPVPTRETGGGSRLATGLAVVALLACGVLGYLVYNQGEKLRNAEAALDRKVEDAQTELASLVAAAIAKVPDVDAVRRDVDDLEERLFGFGPSGIEQDVIGDLRRNLSSIDSGLGRLELDLSFYKSCMNRALSSSFASYDRAANSYFGGGSYYVSRC